MSDSIDTILMVDDDKFVIRVLSTKLAYLGYEVSVGEIVRKPKSVLKQLHPVSYFWILSWVRKMEPNFVLGFDSMKRVKRSLSLWALLTMNVNILNVLLKPVQMTLL
jgi:hypothetical protein